MLLPELYPLPNLYVETLIPNMTEYRDRIFKQIIKDK